MKVEFTFSNSCLWLVVAICWVRWIVIWCPWIISNLPESSPVPVAIGTPALGKLLAIVTHILFLMTYFNYVGRALQGRSIIEIEDSLSRDAQMPPSLKLQNLFSLCDLLLQTRRKVRWSRTFSYSVPRGVSHSRSILEITVEPYWGQ